MKRRKEKRSQVPRTVVLLPSLLAAAVAANVTVFALFAAHHSLLARPPVKRLVARVVPEARFRTVYVWTASLLLLLVLAIWQRIAGEVYHVTGWRAAVHAASCVPDDVRFPCHFLTPGGVAPAVSRARSRSVAAFDVRDAAASIASKICRYPVHRQRLPDSASRMRSRDGFGS